MIIKAGDQIIDTRVTPFGLAFATKDEAKIVAEVIASIKNGDTKNPDGYNWFMQTSSDMSKEDVDKWSCLTEDQKVTDMPIKSTKRKFEL